MLFQLLLFLLAPIAVYCLILATLNRRLRPLLVRGHWDFVGLLFAASGFFLVVIPGLLVNFYLRSLRQAALEAPLPTIHETIAQLWHSWWWAWLLYYALLVSSAVLLVRWRSSKTAIYNIDPVEFERIMTGALSERGFDGVHVGERWTIRDPNEASRRFAVVDVELFPSMSHVTLHWREHHRSLRDEIETALIGHFRQTATYENAAAGWFLGISGFLFGLLFLIVLVMILSELFPARRG